jgi:hypothetical protein
LFALLATASHERLGPITREPMVAAGSLLGFSAVVGVLAMAALEVLRRLIPLRGWFHRREHRDWFRQRELSSWFAELYRARPPHDLAWFDVPREQFIAQLASLAEIELARHEFARSAAEPAGGRFAVRPKKSTNKPSAANMEDAEARANIEIQLDAFEASLAFRWQRMLRLSACALAGACGLVTATFSGADIGAVAVSTGAAFVFGGFFAWLARDLVAVVEGWRRSP